MHDLGLARHPANEIDPEQAFDRGSRWSSRWILENNGPNGPFSFSDARSLRCHLAIFFCLRVSSALRLYRVPGGPRVPLMSCVICTL
jgi:hypothetical protein